MRLKIAIGPHDFGSLGGDAIEVLKRAVNVEALFNETAAPYTADAWQEVLSNAHGAILRHEPLTAEVLGAAANLKVVASMGFSSHEFDLAAARDANVKFKKITDGVEASVAEYTLTALLGIYRGWGREISPHEAREIRESTVLLLGFPGVAGYLHEPLQSLGARVLVWEPLLGEDALPGKVQPVGLEEGLAQADAIVLLTGHGDLELQATHLEACKPGAVLLHPGIGSSANLKDIATSLETKQLARFWMASPTGLSHVPEKLANQTRAFLTQDAASQTPRAKARQELSAAEFILKELRGMKIKRQRR
jgi:D-3-phosphoglycerate dehydrogenase/(S)-sulfolactate dehydrogenase